MGRLLSIVGVLEHLFHQVFQVFWYLHLLIIDGEWNSEQTIEFVVIDEYLSEIYFVVHFKEHKEDLCGQKRVLIAESFML